MVSSRSGLLNPMLLEIEGDAPGRSYNIDRPVVTIGRDSTCEIVLGSGKAKRVVSSMHARIYRRPDGCFIEDLNSRNGTYLEEVNSLDGTYARKQRVERLLRLRDGCVVRICNYRLLFQDALTIVPVQDDEPTILGVLDVDSASSGHWYRSRPEEKLKGVLRISQSLARAADEREMFEQAMASLLDIFPQAERAFALLADEAGAIQEESIALRSRTEVAGGPILFRSIAARAVVDGQAILIEDTLHDSRVRRDDSVFQSPITTMMCVPLRNRERRCLGLIQVDSSQDRGRFRQQDLEVITAIASQITLFLENTRMHVRLCQLGKVEQESQDAARVQQAFLPRTPPALPDYEFYHVYRPAQYVGGDYFDYLRPLDELDESGSSVRDPRAPLVLAVADVAGKGLPAALMMARLAAQLQLLIQAGLDLVEMIERLNHELCLGDSDHRYTSFLLAELDARRHVLRIVNAGHPRPVVRRADGRIETVGEHQSGMLLGVRASARYEPASVALAPGDAVLFYTDGVSEATNTVDELFGTPRLVETVRQADGGAAGIGAAILNAVSTFVGETPPSDDLTLICLRRSDGSEIAAGSDLGRSEHYPVTGLATRA
jgi:serine phosphatase RsbU (regulator of sigma subunit)/pSer/pThr/pTyr-binding forkhead associated (FHA) protein